MNHKIVRLSNPSIAAPLFDGWQETLIWSCLQDVMGDIYADSDENPVSAMALIGDFCFFAGEPDPALVLYKPESCTSDFVIMTPQSEAWAKLIESCYQEKAKQVTRYAIKKEQDIFDQNMLQEVVKGLPAEYTMKMLEEDCFKRCKEQEWCRDWVSQYANYEEYKQHGLGVVLLKEDEIVSGASSYTVYLGGIEIQIDTKEEYRRKGLARICGAKLILECLKRNLYPSWDAQNKGSVALAETLGYHFDHEYIAYDIIGW